MSEHGHEPSTPAYDELQRRAEQLGISREAVELYAASEVVDLHVDSFIWTRVLGYDLRARHGRGLLGARYYSQVDFPRALEAGLGGALWSITTNPLRGAAARARTLSANVRALEAICESAADQVQLVRTLAEYRAARAARRHAVLISVQGGNALCELEACPELERGAIVAVTLLHLTSSELGIPSAAFRRRDVGLSPAGHAQIERLNHARVFVDLAHVNRRGFFDALATHDKTQPLLVSHTGVSAVTPSWRNIDDEQLRAIADRAGVIGVIFHGGFVGGGYWSGGRSAAIVDHLVHIVDSVGEDHAALGSDWDGAIITPRDMRTCLELPRLVQHMLDRGLSPLTVQKILGGNFLRALGNLRGES